ncbi:MAG TPA: nuclear transport factor 2 family protein [Nocardioides sp.]
MDQNERMRIRDLAATYASAVDRRSYPLLASTFGDKGKLVLPSRLAQAGGVIVGGTAIAEHIQRLHAVYETTFHILGQQLIELDGERGSGETYCTAHHLFEHDKVQVDRILHIRYDDTYHSVKGSWRFAERRVNLVIVDYRPVTSQLAAL